MRRGPDGEGEPITRRDMAEIKGLDAPTFNVPIQYRHYLEWFWEIDGSYRPPIDGDMNPIGPWMHVWERDSGTLLTYADKRIMLKMDTAFRAGMSKTRADFVRHERQKQDNS